MWANLELLIWPSIFVILIIVLSVSSDGEVSVEFIEYRNPSGKGANGHCCDGKYALCQNNGCDYIFRICLGHQKRTNDCSLGEKRSSAIENQNTVNFSRTEWGLDNPVRFRIAGDTIPQKMVLSVHVEDYDSGVFWSVKNDFVDQLYLDLDFTLMLPSHRVQRSLVGRTSLNVRYGYNCDIGWFGPLCSNRCQNISEHEEGWDEAANCNTTATADGITNASRPSISKLTFKSNNDYDADEIDEDANDNNDDDVDDDGDDDTEYEDCDTLASSGRALESGVYRLKKSRGRSWLAYCHLSSERRGWTLIQRRISGREDFNRTWEEYKRGFGEIRNDSDFWIGLEKIHRWTRNKSYILWIDLVLPNGQKKFSLYNQFGVENETNNYRLQIGLYVGNAGDGLSFPGIGGQRTHRLQMFSTPDRDNDGWPTGNCAKKYQSGWWFNNCFWGNLNGRYLSPVDGWPYCFLGKCIAWRALENLSEYSIIQTQMAILPTKSSK